MCERSWVGQAPDLEVGWATGSGSGLDDEVGSDIYETDFTLACHLLFRHGVTTAVN